MSTFAKHLKQLRKKYNITQGELAQKLNVSQNAIYNWENNKREPSSAMVEKMAKIFNISPSCLMGWEALDDAIKETDTRLSNTLEKKLLSNEAFKVEDGNHILTFSSKNYSIEELTKILEYALFLKMQRTPEKTIELSDFLNGNF